MHEYEIDVDFIGDRIWFVCRQSSANSVTLHIKEGVVVDAKGGDLEHCRSVYQELAIDTVFDRVADDLEHYAPLKETLRIDFEPRWGYVERYLHTYHGSLLDSRSVFDTRIEVRAFRPLR